MASPRFTGQISLGNLIQILILVVGIAAGWVTVTEKLKVQGAKIGAVEAAIMVLPDLKSDIELNQREITRVAGTVSEHSGRLRAVETNAARDNQRLDNILEALGRIETQITRMQEKGTAVR